MMHPMSWPDIILGVLIAEGFLYSVRSVSHYVSNRKHNILITQRVEQMRPGALDNYRYTVKGEGHAPLG